MVSGGWVGGGGGNRRKPLGEIRVEFNALNCVKLSKSTAKRRDRIWTGKYKMVRVTVGDSGLCWCTCITYFEC